MKQLKYYFYLVISLLLVSCFTTIKTESTTWCDEADLSMYAGLEEINTESEWFKVFVVGEHVFALAEPYHYEEVISYFIVGTKQALLFDSGNGLGSISSVVKELTNLPVIALNSHTHYDRIGGNNEFDNDLMVGVFK